MITAIATQHDVGIGWFAVAAAGSLILLAVFHAGRIKGRDELKAELKRVPLRNYVIDNMLDGDASGGDLTMGIPRLVAELDELAGYQLEEAMDRLEGRQPWQATKAN